MSGWDDRDAAIRALAEAAQLATSWIDHRGTYQPVGIATLQAVLASLGLPSQNADDIAESRQRLAREQSEPRPLITAEMGATVTIPGSGTNAQLTLEDGRVIDLTVADGQFVAPHVPGYHRLTLGEREITLAVAPRQAWRIEDCAPGRRLWGTAAQVYSLRGGTTAGFGDFAALAELAEGAAASGADAVAMSPVHALFAADPWRYGPYGPSTRLFLNPLYSQIPSTDRTGADEVLIDWPAAARAKWAVLRAAHTAWLDQGSDRVEFDAFVAAGGEPLLDHARFEALDGRFRPQGLYHWRHWPGGYADIDGPAVAALTADDPEVAFHLFAQWQADRSLGRAQARARQAGMAIGLIADLAVGMDGSGSHAWSRPQDVLTGIGVGAPPDPLGPDGQNWGLTTFSPRGLQLTGFSPYLATIRAALRHAGGLRMDHVMGLTRLWVVPDGASPTEGTYLTYPAEDMFRLLALESWRHKAIVIGEDLGTVPDGFRPRMAARGLMGMRVLWFERTHGGGFIPAPEWEAEAVAMTTTHDLPTIAGWSIGSDNVWRDRIRPDPGHLAHVQAERERDKAELDRTIGHHGGDETLVDDAIAYVGSTPCRLAIVPIEDLVGEAEQPNLPGTIDQHPNWRRRMPEGDLFARPDVRRRVTRLAEARSDR